MITISNSDAEKMIEHLSALAEILSSRITPRSSTKEINNLRLLNLLNKKFAKKLEAAKPQ